MDRNGERESKKTLQLTHTQTTRFELQTEGIVGEWLTLPSAPRFQVSLAQSAVDSPDTSLGRLQNVCHRTSSLLVDLFVVGRFSWLFPGCL